MKTTRGTSQQVAADDVSQWRELQDFRDKAKQSLEAGEMTEAEYDQMMDIADEWESQLMGKGDTGLQHSFDVDENDGRDYDKPISDLELRGELKNKPEVVESGMLSTAVLPIRLVICSRVSMGKS